jgi:aminoacrylate hydrolase
MALIKLRDGEQLFYEKHGAGPALLLVAGLGGVGTFWGRHIAALAKHFTVVVHDHRGCGRSAHSRIAYSVDQMAADVLDLMSALDIERAHFIGHSTGGAIGQILALDHPARIDRLVLSSTWTSADAYMKRLFDLRGGVLAKGGDGLYRSLSNLIMYPPWWIALNAEALEASQASSDIPATPRDIAQSRIDAIMRFDRSKDLARLAHRCLVMCARDDLITPVYYSEALARAMPNARLAVLPTGGHFYNHVCPGDFERLSIEFLTAPA